VHEAALFVLRAQSSSRAQVGLVGQHDKKFRLLAIGKRF
jgi:hypothetical protein